jgi:hypothetical protein
MFSLWFNLTVFSAACAASIPVPEAGWIPAPEEVRRAPAFPLYDANCKQSERFRLPPDVKVTYQFTAVDHVIDTYPVFPGGPPASQRDRQLRIVEEALQAPGYTQRVVLFDETLRIQITRYADPAQVAALLEKNRSYDRQMGKLGENVALGEDAYFSSLAFNKSLNLAVKQGVFHISISISTQIKMSRDYWPDQCEAKLKQLEVYVARLIVSRLPVITKPPVVVPPKPPTTPPPGQHPEVHAPGYEPPLPPIPTQPGRRYWVYIDGQLMRTQAPPTEVNGRVLVGLADIFRELGADVVWKSAEKQIIATRGSRVVQLWIGRRSALVDSQVVTLDVPPMILAGGKTYVPVRFVSQALGAGVKYEAASASVLITTGSMPPLGGATATPPYTPPPPAQGLVQVAICRETGLKATGLCPNTVPRPFAPGAVPGPCTTHAQGRKLIVLSPAQGATVPEQFTVSGTGIPGKSVRVTAVAEGTLLATGQHATSPLITNAEAKVTATGHWSIAVNARAVRRDQRIKLKQFTLSVQMPLDGRAVERIVLVVYP